MSNAPGTCGSCKYSIPAKKSDGTIDFRQRFCRRFPPTPIMMPTAQGPTIQFILPTLDVNATCWEFMDQGAEVLLPGEVIPPTKDVTQ